MPEGIDRRSSSDPSAPPADGAPAAPAPERSGPLVLERHRKADGRLLILYSRESDTGGRAPGTGAPAPGEGASTGDG